LLSILGCKQSNSLEALFPVVLSSEKCTVALARLMHETYGVGFVAKRSSPMFLKQEICEYLLEKDKNFLVESFCATAADAARLFHLFLFHPREPLILSTLLGANAPHLIINTLMFLHEYFKKEETEDALNGMLFGASISAAKVWKFLERFEMKNRTKLYPSQIPNEYTCASSYQALATIRYLVEERKLPLAPFRGDATKLLRKDVYLYLFEKELLKSRGSELLNLYNFLFLYRNLPFGCII
jgi:hypothetical protein